MPHRIFVSLIVSIAGFTAGCSGDDVPLADVSGRVTFNGVPLPAEIVFQPEQSRQNAGGRPSTAFTTADGSFTLSYSEGRQGAVVGRHRVVIKVMQAPQADQLSSYREATAAIKTSRLVRQVRRGSNRFTFALTY